MSFWEEYTDYTVTHLKAELIQSNYQIDWDTLLHDEHKKHPAQPEPEPLANPFQSALCDLEANNTVEVINGPTIAEDTTKWLPQEERVGISQMNGDRIAIPETAN